MSATAPYHGFDQIINWKVGEGAYKPPGIVQSGRRLAAGSLEYIRGTAGGGGYYGKNKERGGECSVIMTADTFALLAYAVRTEWPSALTPLTFQVGNTAASRVQAASIISEATIEWALNEPWKASFKWICPHEAARAASATQSALTAGAIFPAGYTAFAVGGLDLQVQKFRCTVKTGAHYFDGGSSKAAGQALDPLGVVGGWETYDIALTAMFDPGYLWDADFPAHSVGIGVVAKDNGATQKTWTQTYVNLGFSPIDIDEQIKKGDEQVELDLVLTGERAIGSSLSCTYL